MTSSIFLIKRAEHFDAGVLRVPRRVEEKMMQPVRLGDDADEEVPGLVGQKVFERLCPLFQRQEQFPEERVLIVHGLGGVHIGKIPHGTQVGVGRFGVGSFPEVGTHEPRGQDPVQGPRGIGLGDVQDNGPQRACSVSSGIFRRAWRSCCSRSARACPRSWGPAHFPNWERRAGMLPGRRSMNP